LPLKIKYRPIALSSAGTKKQLLSDNFLAPSFLLSEFATKDKISTDRFILSEYQKQLLSDTFLAPSFLLSEFAT
jgi:hypothetical protein